VPDDPRSGQPKTQRPDTNMDRVRTVVCSDRRVGWKVIAEVLNMNRETVRQILKEDLRMRKFSAKMVPRILTHDQKQRRLHISCLAKNSITKMDHSPDVAPCDFWLFPKLKNALKGRKFPDLFDIQRNVKTLLRGTPENDFQDCFRRWHLRLMKCIASQGESKAAVAVSVQASKFCFHRAIPGIKLSHLLSGVNRPFR
jgi:hypothetical protein